MKIAIQFSGQLRSFVQASHFFYRNLLDLVDCDIFLSTWSEMPSQLFRDDVESVDKAIDEFTKIYDVKGLVTEPLLKDTLAEIIEICKSGWVIPIKNVKIEYMVYGFYQKFKCNLLRKQYEIEHGISYDTIFVVRPDLVIAEPFPIHLLEHTKDFLLIPAGSDWEYGTNDLLAIGNDVNITKYCELFLHLERYIKHRIMVHPEHINKYHLDDMAVPIRRFPLTTHLRARRMT